MDVVKKPIIYIYPTKEIDLSIKLKNNKKLTTSYPKYNNRWNIHVDTNGNIYDYNTKRNYYALYWEAHDNTHINMNAGFVVKNASVASNGNGGGSPTFAQGGGKEISNLKSILEEVGAALNECK